MFLRFSGSPEASSVRPSLRHFAWMLVLAGGLVAPPASCPQAVAAESTPFQAVVTKEEAAVFSGYGGEGHVQTSTLKRGDRVTVVRQDFSGWYMIEPPEDSFSWIRQDAVERRGGNTAIVRSDEAVDWIGSNVDSSGLKIFHKLSRGERVDILGERVFHKGSEPVPMFKIRPPRGEYRYIRRQDVVKASESGEPDLLTSSQADQPAGIRLSGPEVDPFSESSPATEASRSRPPGGQPPGVSTARSASDTPTPLPLDGGFGQSPARPGEGSHVGPDIAFERLAPIDETPLDPVQKQVIENIWDELESIDIAFHQMVRQDSKTWDLDTIESRYSELRRRNPSDTISRMLDQRMAAIQRYEKIQTLDNEIRSIMSQTEARDEQIRKSYSARWHSASTTSPPQTIIRSPHRTPPQQAADGQRSSPPPAASPAAAPVPSPSNPPVLAAPPLQNRPIPSTAPQPVTPPTPARQQIGSGAPGTAARATRQPPRPFDGAGIIQRSASPQASRATHVLLAPNGRVLTYLQAGPGINLDHYLGRSMGLHGPRSFRQELNADFMIVRRLTPVRLLP